MTRAIGDIDTLIFDFDGTIADTMELGIVISNSLASKYGYKTIKDRADLAKYRNQPTQEAIKAIGISFFKLPLIANSFRKRLSKHIDELKPIPGVLEILPDLSKKYKMGIITSNSLKNLNKFLAKYNLQHCFSFYATGISLFKKHQVINNLVKKEHLHKDSILLIGDETREIDAAKNSGIAVASVTWGFHTTKILQEKTPDFLIHTPKELHKLLTE